MNIKPQSFPLIFRSIFFCILIFACCFVMALPFRHIDFIDRYTVTIINPIPLANQCVSLTNPFRSSPKNTNTNENNSIFPPPSNLILLPKFSIVNAYFAFQIRL